MRRRSYVLFIASLVLAPGLACDGGTGAAVDDGPTSSAESCSAVAPSAARALWVWHDVDLEAHFELLADHAIDTVWIDAHEMLADTPELFEAYLLQAQQHCVEVEVLLGSSNSWALTAHHDEVLGRIDDVVAAAGDGTPALVGVHLDVEPHALDAWDEDEAAVGAQLAQLYSSVAERLSGSGLRATADIPFWYDGVIVPDPAGGLPRPLSELAIDALDRVVVLAYRDEAEGSDGVIALAEGEMSYATAVGGTVVVGVETKCDLEPEKLSFCEEGVGALEAALVEVRAAFDAEPSFGGVAIHHHDTLAALGP